jgi:hypothetical protein
LNVSIETRSAALTTIAGVNDDATADLDITKMSFSNNEIRRVRQRPGAAIHRKPLAQNFF